jgi:hypothetical protein
MLNRVHNEQSSPAKSRRWSTYQGSETIVDPHVVGPILPHIISEILFR